MDFDLPPALGHLPLHRTKVEAACRRGLEIPELAGMVIGGSFSIGIADEYSDLDFKLVSTDEGFDTAQARRDEIVDSCGRVVARFPADHLGMKELLIVLYDDLVHADFLVVKLSELAAKNEGMPTFVLWDRDGAVTRELAKPAEERPPTDVAWLEQRMWTWLWYTQSKILRGELFEALEAIQWLRGEVLFPLLGLRRQAPVYGSRRIESILGDLDQSFSATAAGADRSELMNALREIARIYRVLADPLLEASGLSPANAARSTVEPALNAGLDWRPLAGT